MASDLGRCRVSNRRRQLRAGFWALSRARAISLADGLELASSSWRLLSERSLKAQACGVDGPADRSAEPLKVRLVKALGRMHLAEDPTQRLGVGIANIHDAHRHVHGGGLEHAGQPLHALVREQMLRNDLCLTFALRGTACSPRNASTTSTREAYAASPERFQRDRVGRARASLRFSRSFFCFLRSFRQRLTGLEPRPIASDPSESGVEHKPGVVDCRCRR